LQSPTGFFYQLTAALSEITTIQKGSEKAFTQVYSQYHVKLYRYFLKKTRSDEMATELVQIVFIKLWRFKHTLSENYSLDTQLFNMARTCLIDFIRQQSIQKTRLVNLETDADINIYTQPDLSFEMTDYFNHAIKTLPPVRKKVFILSRLQGLSYHEIAQHLSISIHTVEDHMTKAIRHIKALSSFLWLFFLYFLPAHLFIIK